VLAACRRGDNYRAGFTRSHTGSLGVNRAGGGCRWASGARLFGLPVDGERPGRNSDGSEMTASHTNGQDPGNNGDSATNAGWLAMVQAKR
jgi:hypothetical protein